MPSISLPTVALAVGAAGAGVSAYGTYEQGQAQAHAANYQAQVSANNTTIANQNAEYAISAGEAQSANVSRKGASNIGKIKTSQAASGVDVNSGSAVGVQEGARDVNKLDTETVLNNSQLQAYGYRSQATSFAAQGGLQQLEAEQAPIGADLAAGGGFLGNASSLGTKWATLGPGGGVQSFDPSGL